MLENFQGDSWGSIPPLRMRSLLPHDLCHGWSSSRWLLAVIEFQLSYSRSWKMMLWKVLHSICNMQYALNMQYAGSRQNIIIFLNWRSMWIIQVLKICPPLILKHLEGQAKYSFASVIALRATIFSLCYWI